MVGRATLPPAGIVIKLRDLVEAELLVVVRTDPFGGIDCALLQRWINIAAGDLLRNDTKLAKRLSGPSADAHLEAVQVIDGLDFLFEPAAHLAPGVTHEKALGVELGTELVDELLAIAFMEPRILLAGIKAERHGAKQRPRRILANVVVLCAVAHFDGTVLDRV